jgi:UDP-N-acetylglucosamine--N-acetylmuramyl-(pentapeptide) pyrophosphoryl-undecaprenol N-acetylglucosamine transferase
VSTAVSSEPVVLLAAGGTGGHLFPALALAEELGRRAITVDLVTDRRGDRFGTGFPARQIHSIPSATHAGWSPLSAAHAVARLGWGTAAAYRLLGRIQPAAVVGFGGYPTLPPLTAARLRRLPTDIHEQNAVLGRANRLLSRGVTAIAASFETTRFLDAGLASRVHVTGNPVRDNVLKAAGKPYQAPRPGERFRLLVFGGSQGARFLSDAVPEALLAMSSERRSSLEVVQQCRAEDLDRVRDAYARGGISAELSPFFKNLPDLMADADLVVARSGASTVAELTVLGRPSILIPLPHALDNDQLHNATHLAQSGAAWCIEQKDAGGGRLSQLLDHLMSQPGELQSAGAAAKGLARPDAAMRLADLVEKLIGREPTGRHESAMSEASSRRFG